MAFRARRSFGGVFSLFLLAENARHFLRQTFALGLIQAGQGIAELLRDGKEEVARVKVEAIIRDDMLMQAFEASLPCRLLSLLSSLSLSNFSFSFFVFFFSSSDFGAVRGAAAFARGAAQNADGMSF